MRKLKNVILPLSLGERAGVRVLALLLLLTLAACQGASQSQPLPPAVATGSSSATTTGGGRPQVTAVLPAAGAAAPTAAPSSTPTPDPTQEAENRIVTLDYPMSADPGSLDPALVLSGDRPGQDAAGALFARLTRLDPTTGEVKPWLAKSWTIDGQTVRCTELAYIDGVIGAPGE